jgi:hypothetical protein
MLALPRPVLDRQTSLPLMVALPRLVPERLKTSLPLMVLLHAIVLVHY